MKMDIRRLRPHTNKTLAQDLNPALHIPYLHIATASKTQNTLNRATITAAWN